MINNNELIGYNYYLYGLKIVSEIPLSELIAVDRDADGQPDVTISLGIVPKNIEASVVKDGYLKMSKKEFYLYINGVAHYYVTNGNKIIVEPEERDNMEEIKVFLLGTCFGILLAQKNTIAIHGGAVVVDGLGIIITGHTGAGKSTLAAAFRNEGHAFLADDVSALKSSGESNFIIYPTYPQQKLCKDAMKKFGYDVERFSMIDPYREKYSLPLTSNYSRKAVSLTAIYEVAVTENSNVEITELLGGEKLRTILRNTYRSEVNSLVGYDPQYFKQCVELVKKIPVYRITRPKGSFTVEKQMDVIKNSLLNLKIKDSFINRGWRIS